MRWLLVFAVACGAPPEPKIISHRAVDSPPPAGSCGATAKRLSEQGTASDEVRRWRVETVLRLCTEDDWPESVRDCAATADHDPLQCTAYFTTDLQRAHWNAAFEEWASRF